MRGEVYADVTKSPFAQNPLRSRMNFVLMFGSVSPCVVVIPLRCLYGFRFSPVIFLFPVSVFVLFIASVSPFVVVIQLRCVSGFRFSLVICFFFVSDLF